MNKTERVCVFVWNSENAANRDVHNGMIDKADRFVYKEVSEVSWNRLEIIENIKINKQSLVFGIRLKISCCLRERTFNLV